MPHLTGSIAPGKYVEVHGTQHLADESFEIVNALVQTRGGAGGGLCSYAGPDQSNSVGEVFPEGVNVTSEIPRRITHCIIDSLVQVSCGRVDSRGKPICRYGGNGCINSGVDCCRIGRSWGGGSDPGINLRVQICWIHRLYPGRNNSIHRSSAHAVYPGVDGAVHLPFLNPPKHRCIVVNGRPCCWVITSPSASSSSSCSSTAGSGDVALYSSQMVIQSLQFCLIASKSTC